VEGAIVAARQQQSFDIVKMSDKLSNMADQEMDEAMRQMLLGGGNAAATSGSGSSKGPPRPSPKFRSVGDDSVANTSVTFMTPPPDKDNGDDEEGESNALLTQEESHPNPQLQPTSKPSAKANPEASIPKSNAWRKGKTNKINIAAAIKQTAANARVNSKRKSFKKKSPKFNSVDQDESALTPVTYQTPSTTALDTDEDDEVVDQQKASEKKSSLRSDETEKTRNTQSSAAAASKVPSVVGQTPGANSQASSTGSSASSSKHDSSKGVDVTMLGMESPLEQSRAKRKGLQQSSEASPQRKKTHGFDLSKLVPVKSADDDTTSPAVVPPIDSSPEEEGDEEEENEGPLGDLLASSAKARQRRLSLITGGKLRTPSPVNLTTDSVNASAAATVTTPKSVTFSRNLTETLGSPSASKESSSNNDMSLDASISSQTGKAASSPDAADPRNDDFEGVNNGDDDDDDDDGGPGFQMADQDDDGDDEEKEESETNEDQEENEDEEQESQQEEEQDKSDKEASASEEEIPEDEEDNDEENTSPVRTPTSSGSSKSRKATGSPLAGSSKSAHSGRSTTSSKSSRSKKQSKRDQARAFARGRRVGSRSDSDSDSDRSSVGAIDETPRKKQRVGDSLYEIVPVTNYKTQLDSDEEAKGLRRSRRAKFPALKWWKNERVIYESADRRQSAMGMLEKAHVDMSVAVKVQRALPTPIKPRATNHKKAGAKKGASKKAKEDDDEDSIIKMEPFDDRRLRAKRIIMEGNDALVWDEETGELVDRRTIMRATDLNFSELPVTAGRKMGESSVVGMASQAFNIGGVKEHIPGWISGQLTLPPKGIKDAEGVGECSQVFYVGDCQPNSCEVAIANPEETDFDPKTAQRFLLSKGDFFHVPPNNVYRAQNHSTLADCKLYWTIIRPINP
jgi:hypothetical protein